MKEITQIELVYLKNKDKILEKAGLPKDFYDYMPPEMLAGTLKVIVCSMAQQKQEKEVELIPDYSKELEGQTWYKEKIKELCSFGFSKEKAKTFINEWYHRKNQMMQVMKKYQFSGIRRTWNSCRNIDKNY